MPDQNLINVELTEQERYVLIRGLAEWGGPAHCPDDLAVGIGFDSAADLLSEGRRLREALRDGQPFSRQDWRRALVATEIAFASDVYGSGWDWSITSGLSDEEPIRILRSLQRKLARSVRVHQP
jgi:hypothetical protein